MAMIVLLRSGDATIVSLFVTVDQVGHGEGIFYHLIRGLDLEDVS